MGTSATARLKEGVRLIRCPLNTGFTVLRPRLKPPTPIKSDTNNSLLSDKQVCRKTHAAQVNLKMWGWKDNKSHSFPRYTQKRQTIAHEKQLIINQLIDDIPTSYT